MILWLNLQKAVFKQIEILTSKLHFTSFSLSLISTVNVFLVLFNAFSLLISRASYTFPLYTFEIMAIVLRLIWIVEGTFWCVQWRPLTFSYRLCCLVDAQCNTSILCSLIWQYIYHWRNNQTATLQDVY